MPLLERVPASRVAIVILGGLTAVYALSVGRARADIKTALAYASASQVGLIWVEVGLGFTTLALVHIVGHAILRTWQLLSSPSSLAVLGPRKRRAGLAFFRVSPWVYRQSVVEWHLDDLGKQLVFRPIGAVLHLFDDMDVRLRGALGAADQDDRVRRVTTGASEGESR